MPLEVLPKTEDWNEFNSSLLIEVKRPNGVFTCTGVAVSKELIVTAAHCLEGNVDSIRVFLDNRYDPKAKSLGIKNFKIHPSYNSKISRYESDMAKIVLAEKLPDNITVHSIYNGSTPFGKFLRFGFGERNKKNVRTVITPKLRGINGKILELNDQFSYSGDSGGPIFLQNGSDTSVVAIHSTLSFGPEGRYSFNPMLAPFKDWIFEN